MSIHQVRPSLAKCLTTPTVGVGMVCRADRKTGNN